MWMQRALVVAVIAGSPLSAQDRPPFEGGTTVSLGQPREWKWTVGGGAGRYAAEGSGNGIIEGRASVQRDLVNPVASVAAMHGEVYLGYRDRELDRGVRARLTSPAGGFGIGADYNFLDGRTHVLLSLAHPIRRGGLLGDGGNLRLDYLPGRSHTLTLGLERPIARRIPMGSTRPARDHIRLERPALPREPRPATNLGLEGRMTDAATVATRIRRLTIPFIDRGGWSRREAEVRFAADVLELRDLMGATAADGDGLASSPESDVRRFNALLEEAFSVAATGRALVSGESTPAGRAIAARARSILLTEVLLPYDRLLGQTKRPDTSLEFAAHARGVFLRWLHVGADIPLERVGEAMWVFTELLAIVEANRAAALEEWGDSRFVWLPLQYALLPEQHDTQAELDALVELAVGQEFTEGNFVSYVINEQFQYHLSRTIRAAERYHVLWTHDFRGFDSYGDPDEMSFRHVTRSYLRAMTERVRAYDSTGTFPVYMILLDEWFYHVTQGRLWMNVLEDPLGRRLDLPAGYEAWEDSLAAAQDSLRAAVAASTLLSAQRRQYGEGWLRNLIKVHVNISNPADPSFWSRGVVRGVAVPDNMMRDHRKVVFYDITEEDPYRGEALYTGAGVGEHYTNITWEDRAILVRGPAALGLKNAAREALMNQGVDAARIPWPLQPRPFASDYETRIAEARQRNQQPLRALDVHNGTGFNAKRLNVTKAVLYTLMPTGSVIKIPDSLWSSSFWGGALLGGALRGVRVLIIAPAEANAPALAFGTLGRSQELLWRLLEAQRLLDPEIRAAGGLLKIGLYAPTFKVTDIPAKVRAVKATFEQHVWLRDLFGFPAPVYEELAELASTLQSLLPPDTAGFEHDEYPKLHLKANLLATREAWTLMTRPEWGSVTWGFVMMRIAQVQGLSAVIASFDEYPDPLNDVGGAVVEDWYGELDPAVSERVAFYAIMGSQNQNYRSMVVDGEVGFVVSGWPSIIPHLDFISLIGQSRWVENPAELAALLPQHSQWRWRISRWAKVVL